MKRHTFTILILILSVMALGILWMTPITQSQVIQEESEGDTSLFRSSGITGLLFEQRDSNEYAINYMLNNQGAIIEQNAIFEPRDTFFYEEEVINAPMNKRPVKGKDKKVAFNDKHSLFMDQLYIYSPEEDKQLNYSLLDHDTKEFQSFTYQPKNPNISAFGINAVVEDSTARIFYEIYQMVKDEDGVEYQTASNKMLAIDIDLNTGKVLQEKEMTMPKDLTGRFHLIYDNNYNPTLLVNHVFSDDANHETVPFDVAEEEETSSRWAKTYQLFEVYDSELQKIHTIKNNRKNETIDNMMVVGDKVFAVVVSLEMNPQNLPSYVSIQELDRDKGTLQEIERFEDAAPLLIKEGHLAIETKASDNQASIQFYNPDKQEIAYKTSFQARGSEDLDFQLLGAQY